MSGKKNPLGPFGENVSVNVKRLRESQNLTFAEVARRLTGIERAIPTLGLRHIETSKRRVDADDLVALATVLGVSVAVLLDEPARDGGALDLVTRSDVQEMIRAAFDGQ